MKTKKQFIYICILTLMLFAGCSSNFKVISYIPMNNGKEVYIDLYSEQDNADYVSYVKEKYASDVKLKTVYVRIWKQEPSGKIMADSPFGPGKEPYLHDIGYQGLYTPYLLVR